MFTKSVKLEQSKYRKNGISRISHKNGSDDANSSLYIFGFKANSSLQGVATTQPTPPFLHQKSQIGW